MKLSDFFVKDEIIRDGEFNTLGRADSDIEHTLVYCDSMNFFEMAVKNDDVTCIIAGKENGSRSVKSSKGLVRSVLPRNAFYRLHNILVAKGLVVPKIKYGKGTGCKIHTTASISPRTRIGNNVTISENVVVKDYVEIGDNTFIDVGTIIGPEGVLYMFEKGKLTFIRHAGGVRIGKNVTILSNVVIVRSIHDSFLTDVGDNSLIGIGTTIGHDAQVSRNCAILGKCVIARRSYIENNAWIGTGSITREYVRIGNGARIMAGSVVIKDVEAGAVVSGNFAFDHKKHLRNYLNARK